MLMSYDQWKAKNKAEHRLTHDELVWMLSRMQESKGAGDSGESRTHAPVRRYQRKNGNVLPRGI